ncbi:MAG: glycosyltransferase [Acidobacteriota bacterium]|nr:glycosyltransferase [Acidobacteriota bacterium]
MPVPVLLMVRELGPGGTERQMTEIAKHLDRSQFSPYVGCFHSDGMRGDELEAAGIPVVRFPVKSLVSPGVLSGVREMGQFLRRNRIRIVHAFDVPMNIFGVPVARFVGTPVVISSQRAYRELVSPVHRRLLRLCDCLSTATVVNCHAIERHLVEDYGVPSLKIQVCYNGLDPSTFYRRERRRSDGVVIGGVYALRPEKNIETLLEAFALMRARKPAPQLLIVGSGVMETSLKERASNLGIGRNVRFEPASADVAARMNEIDIFVLPSVSEALSNSLMEAMACGCAVTASRVGGNPELVREGETGLLFEARDATGLARNLELLVDQEDLRHRLASAGAEFIRGNFSVEASARRMGEIYTSLLAKTGSAASQC